MDRIDLTILRELQEDASQPLEEIARKANSSKTPVWNRIKKMREANLGPANRGVECRSLGV